jgi:hypothetical protein
MENLFVARIHNNSLGSCVMVGTITDGVNLIREYVKDQFGRDLTIEENEILENNYEFYNDDDCDNIYSFSIGSLSTQ